MSDRPDYELLHAWRKGDREAANELMGRYYTGIHRFFTSKVPHVADDLTQQSLLACVEGHSAIRDGASFRSYLFGIAWRKLQDHLRRNDRLARMMMARAAQGPDSVLTPSGVVAKREEQGLLLRALSTLPADMHATVMLFYWEGMSTAEVGSALEVSVTAVTSRLSRARERLREEVEGMEISARLRASLLSDLDGWARSLVTGGPPR
ncbi:MAG: sigma-70 family RNA polymerase sigma factor [Nannocystaceae bacterium]